MKEIQNLCPGYVLCRWPVLMLHAFSKLDISVAYYRRIVCFVIVLTIRAAD